MDTKSAVSAAFARARAKQEADSQAEELNAPPESGQPEEDQYEEKLRLLSEAISRIARGQGPDVAVIRNSKQPEEPRTEEEIRAELDRLREERGARPLSRGDSAAAKAIAKAFNEGHGC